MLHIPGKRLVLAAVVTTIALVAMTYLATAKQVGGTIVLLLDRSPSAQTAAVNACAATVVRAGVEAGATLHIAPVGRMSSANWMHVQTALTGSGRSNSVEGSKQKAAAFAAAMKAVKAVLGGPAPKGGSDYLAATAAAGRLIMQEPGPDRTLAICGDLHAVGSGLNVYRQRLDPDSSRRLIARLQPILPDLGGKVDVVVGAGGLDRRPLSTGREQAIERFWEKYWADAVRARSLRYDSVPHLP